MIDISTAIAAACAGFAAGWVCGTALELRQSYWLDYCRRRSPRRPGPYSNHPQGLPPPPPKAGCTRWFMNNPAIIAKCGGPCTAGHSHCDCGALWVDVPTTNPSEAP